MAFVIGSVITAGIFVGLELFINHQNKKGISVNFGFKKLFGARKSSSVSKVEISTELPE